ncbi:MAG: hypothetical protein RLY31_377, partial [Bacteroidota bacterium]
IEEGLSLGIVDGVTTNPSLLAKEGVAGKAPTAKHFQEICRLVDGDVSAEVISTLAADMVAEGRELADLAGNIVVKIPMTLDGVKAIARLAELGIPTNCTLVFSSAQALLAAKAGATYVSPFIGRIDDLAWDGMELIREIAEIYSVQGLETEILAASIRHPRHITEAAKSGADVVTCPLKTMLAMVNHPLTDIGLQQFLDDHRKANA